MENLFLKLRLKNQKRYIREIKNDCIRFFFMMSLLHFAKAVASKVPIDFYKVDRTIYSIKTLTEVEMPVYRLFRPKLINYEGLVPYVDTFYIFDSTCGELLTDAKIFRLQTTEGNLIHI